MSEDTGISQHSIRLASEMKFLVPDGAVAALIEWARGNMTPDEHGRQGRYRVTSVYFDTVHFDVFHRRGSFRRSKYRVRRYEPGGATFLERKLKSKDLLAKRRLLVADAEAACGSGDRAAGNWFHRRIALRAMRPVCQISYDRTAFTGMSRLGPIRLTLDTNVRAMPARECAFANMGTSQPVRGKEFILELKFPLVLPVSFKSLIAEFALNPQPLSKYRQAVEALGLARGIEKRASFLQPVYA